MIEHDLGEALRDHASRHRVPGAAIGVRRDGDTTFAHCGLANVATGEPVTAETRFSVGSLAKSTVATVIVRLAQSGSLVLDDPVASRVPELAGVGWAANATIRDLLANRSGLPLRLEIEFEPPGDEGDDVLAQFASRLAEAEPACAVWSYTNAGWALLGRVVETVTGQVWEDAMRAHLLDPAGMTQTAFTTQSDAMPRAVGHDGTTPSPPWCPRALGPAGTTMVSTAADMLQFAALHLADDSLAPMCESQTDLRIHGWFDAWCHGWARFDWDGKRVWGWDGLIGGERSFLRFFPEESAAVVLMTNGSTGRAMYRSLFGELFGMPPLLLEATAGAAGDLGRFEGVYAWPDRRAVVKAAGDRLLIDADGACVEALPIDDRTFLVDAADPDNPTVTFGAFDESGRPGTLYLMLWALPREG